MIVVTSSTGTFISIQLFYCFTIESLRLHVGEGGIEQWIMIGSTNYMTNKKIKNQWDMGRMLQVELEGSHEHI